MVQLRKSRKSFRKTRGRKTRQRKNEKRKSRKTRSTRKTGGDWKDWRWNKGSEKIKEKVKEWVELIITDKGELIDDTEMETKMGKIYKIINFLNNDKGFHGISRSSCGENQWCQRRKMIYYSIAVHLFRCLPTNIQTEKQTDLEWLNAKFSKFRDGYIDDDIFLETFWEFRRGKTPEERRDLGDIFEWAFKKEDIVKYFTYIHSFEYLRREKREWKEERETDKFSIFQVFLSGDNIPVQYKNFIQTVQYKNFIQKVEEWNNRKKAVERGAQNDVEFIETLLHDLSKERRREKAQAINQEFELDKNELEEAKKYAKDFLKRWKEWFDQLLLGNDVEIIHEKYNNISLANYLERDKKRRERRKKIENK